ncbi:MAG: hypothetical protein LBR70_00010 [Lactobacillaceae bacterium]|jgi:hypothetical protein|nr:hypothetical protein [Lactobacillaceae bacterium]
MFRLILANLFIAAGLAVLYYFDIFALLASKYMSWFAILMVISVFIIGIKMIGSPFNVQEDDDDNDDDLEDDDSEDGLRPTRKKSL